VVFSGGGRTRKNVKKKATVPTREAISFLEKKGPVQIFDPQKGTKTSGGTNGNHPEKKHLRKEIERKKDLSRGGK